MTTSGVGGNSPDAHGASPTRSAPWRSRAIHPEGLRTPEEDRRASARDVRSACMSSSPKKSPLLGSLSSPTFMRGLRQRAQCTFCVVRGVGVCKFCATPVVGPAKVGPEDMSRKLRGSCAAVAGTWKCEVLHARPLVTSPRKDSRRSAAARWSRTLARVREHCRARPID